ncbi:MFS transporter [Nocardia sp. 348MFTsu5.1]|uniref:MFS transporter n=1 Tax=Nocardia sp. 348MFTsu5.1 TaxID=1172185 RepID=UPI0003639AB3|nr:MFS transporter [Nocardia sp. 348MFTsu5.1]
MTTIPDPIAPAKPVPLAGRYNRNRSAAFIITILVLVEIISAFETSMVFAAIPTIIADFGSDAATVGWAVTAFLLVAAASAAVCGRLGDMFGRERVLVVILATATIGSLVSALGDSVTTIIAGRAIQGVAGAILPLCIGLAREHLTKDKVPVAIAIISGSAVAAGAASAYIAGLMIDHASWHMIFIVAAVYATFALLLVLFALPWRPPVGTTQKVDYVGTIVFAPAIAAILLGINKSSTWGWSDPKTIGLIVTGLVAMALWVVWELRVTDPIANVRLFTNRKVALTMLATLAAAVGPFGIGNMITPLVLQSPTTAPYGLGMSPTDAGLLALIGALIGFAFTPLSGRLTRTVGSRASLIVGGLLYVVVAILLVTSHDSIGGMFAMVTTASIATAFAYTALPNLIVEAVPVDNTSEATGLQTVIRTAGQGIGTSIGTTVLAASAVAGSIAPTVAGLNAVAGIIFAGAVVTVGLALMLRRGSVYAH